MHTPPSPGRCAVVGAGRMGTALTDALLASGVEVVGPLRRDEVRRDLGVDLVLLCVPDAEIARAAAALDPGPLVGHCSGATALTALAPHEAFGLHPLMTVSTDGADFAGATCAVAGTTDRALAAAHVLAERLRMTAFEIDDADRPAYHAAASIASNFLLAVEDAAERLAATTGAGRDMLVPLVRATVDNWAATGAGPALTGPIARGDRETVARQRAAVAERTPDLLALFDALTAATQSLAAREAEVTA
jgi:predicted short-subunit dehydrogenase-like oxidoreductase (DUF2520 family)